MTRTARTSRRASSSAVVQKSKIARTARRPTRPLASRARACVLDKRAGAIGSASRKRVPPPSRGSHVTAPPCASTIWRVIASPSPVPSPFVEKNGSKTRARMSSAIPPPRSPTSITTLIPSAATPTSIVPPSCIASRAFRSKLRRAWRICDSSNSAGGSGSWTCTFTVHPARSISGRAKATISRTAVATSSASIRGEGRRATRRYSSERCSSRSTSRVIDASSARASAGTGAFASSSSSSSMLSPIDESGFRISCVTCAAIFPIAARRSLASARLCARATPATIRSNAAASCPISSSVATISRAVKSPRATAVARSVTRASGASRRRV